jgi:GTP-binding protein
VKFIDEATIIVKSGDGGRGCVSFRRERFIPRGGPDGGDGGKGGDIILKASSHKRTLYHLQFKKLYQAPNGQPGQGRQKSGHSGQDLVLMVPLGTLVKDAQSMAVLYDLVQDDQQVIIAHGGRGGLGNQHFKSATNRAPRYAQPGESGQTLTIKLELKLLADVGIIGLPNAGKSTLICAISSSRAKIANYPFTTLTPNLGVVQYPGAEPFVVADIPGLIEGAHEGAGLGIRFLKHVERTRMLIHLIDAAALNADDPLATYRIVNDELAKYSPALAQKPQLVVLNKIDIEDAQQAADLFCSRFPGGDKVLRISAAGGQGLEAVKSCMLEQLKHLNEHD